jgi:PAS domain S-box-containing protein
LREKPADSHPKLPEAPLTILAERSSFFRRICSELKCTLISDTGTEREWRTFPGHEHFGSWIGVPLTASEKLLGFLSIGHRYAHHLTEDHLRRAQLLAIPAVAAIQNARLYSTAEIYGSELEKRLADLQDVERALSRSESGRKIMEEKFQRVFHSSPIAFSITTLTEGRFLEVNAAFENRYGYRREEILGRTVHELGMWVDPADRKLLLQRLRHAGPVRNVITRLRGKSGDVQLTAYSADRIGFDGYDCVLAVSEDVVCANSSQSN